MQTEISLTPMLYEHVFERYGGKPITSRTKKAAENWLRKRLQREAGQFGLAMLRPGSVTVYGDAEGERLGYNALSVWTEAAMSNEFEGLVYIDEGPGF